MRNQPSAPSQGIARDICERAEARISVDLGGAKLRQRGARGAPVIVQDLSRTGFRTEWPYRLCAGDRVWLTLPGLEAIPAIVRWTKDFTIGCQFEHEMHRAVFDHLLRRLCGEGHRR